MNLQKFLKDPQRISHGSPHGSSGSLVLHFLLKSLLCYVFGPTSTTILLMMKAKLALSQSIIVIVLCVSFPIHQESSHLEFCSMRNNQNTLDWSMLCLNFLQKFCPMVFRLFDLENQWTRFWYLHKNCRAVSYFLNRLRIISIWYL